MPEIIIDGERYVPESSITPVAEARIGIAVTTRDRPTALRKVLDAIAEHTKVPFTLVVVNDAGLPNPTGEVVDERREFVSAYHRFEKQRGIAAAKNRCLELLVEAGAEHLFLFDDDAYPISDDWWKPYVASPEPHLMRIFEDLDGPRKLHDIANLYADDQHTAWTGPRGVMLYVERRVLDVVGGMDPIYGKWGYEHGDWSNRIHHEGLTTWRYADVAGSDRLIHSMDEFEEIDRSIPSKERQELVRRNAEIHNRRRDQRYRGYAEFRTPRTPVLTCLLTGTPDPQRNRKMDASWSMLQELLASVPGEVVVFADELEGEGPGAELERVPTMANPYFARWIHYWRWLREHPEVTKVWCVDGTDVTQLHDPFAMIEPGKLYLGSEPTILGDPWIVKHHRSKDVAEFVAANPRLTLLNAGLVGGDRATVMEFLHGMVMAYFDNGMHIFTRRETERLGLGDMGVFNLIARRDFADRIVTGPAVHTVFKAEDRENKLAAWRHK